MTEQPIDTPDEVKVGMRNSKPDREAIRGIRASARGILDTTMQLEPTDTDDPEPSQEEVIQSLLENAVMSYGGEIKSLDDGRIGGYLVRFGSETQTDISQTRDFFTAETDFGFKRGEKRSTPVYFNHRMPIETKSGDTIRVKERIGDGEMEITDEGVFIEAVLYNRKRYEKMLTAMGWSSGTAPHLIDRKSLDSANMITGWPLGLDASITPTPAEPRNGVIPLKSLELPPVEFPEAGEGESAPTETETGDELPIKSNTTEVIMDITQEQLQSMLTAAATEAIKALPADKPAVGVAVVKDEADQPFAHPGEFFQAVKSAAYYPSSEDPRLRPLKATGMSEGVPADGGYLVSPQVSGAIVEKMLSVGEILRRVSSDSVTGNAMLYNGVDETTHVGSVYGGVIPYWLAEGGTKTASKPKFYQLELKLKKLAALCYATDELLQDSGALESWLARNVPNALRFYAEDAIFNGDGVGKPVGIMNSAALITILRETASSITLTDVANMWSRRWAGARDYVWLINPTAVAQLLIMTASTAPVYMPGGNVAGAPFGTLYGAPVVETEYNAALGTTGDIMLVALSQYQTIQKGGVQAASSIHVSFTTDETAFRFVYRIDGSPLWNGALTPLHGSTISPFVVLASASV